jgi:hypothetical protein
MQTKKAFWLLAFLAVAGLAFGQTVVINSFSSSSLPAGWMPVSGDWKVMNGKLYQVDTRERMALLNIPAPQSGTVQYEFDLEYNGGAEDDYAGFGIHVIVDNPSRGRSWGDGQSALLWVTWDPKQYGAPGLFAQAYGSLSATDMTLYPPRDILRAGGDMPFPPQYVRMEFLGATVPVKIVIDYDTGEMKVYDPLDMRYYSRFRASLPKRSGRYFAFRTNSLSVRIDNFKITKLE